MCIDIHAPGKELLNVVYKDPENKYSVLFQLPGYISSPAHGIWQLDSVGWFDLLMGGCYLVQIKLYLRHSKQAGTCL